jgi:hypothetical protein
MNVMNPDILAGKLAWIIFEFKERHREEIIIAHFRPESFRDCEAFASLFSQRVFEYRQKNPLQYSLPDADFKNL